MEFYPIITKLIGLSLLPGGIRAWDLKKLWRCDDIEKILKQLKSLELLEDERCELDYEDNKSYDSNHSEEVDSENSDKESDDKYITLRKIVSDYIMN